MTEINPYESPRRPAAQHEQEAEPPPSLLASLGWVLLAGPPLLTSLSVLSFLVLDYAALPIPFLTVPVSCMWAFSIARRLAGASKSSTALLFILELFLIGAAWVYTVEHFLPDK